MKAWLGALVATALILSVGPKASAAPEPYEINVILSLTGSAAFIGKEEQTSLGIIERLVNQSGGVRGRPIKFAIQDDQSNPQVGVQIANSIIAKHVPVIIGPTFTAVCNAVLPLIRVLGDGRERRHGAGDRTLPARSPLESDRTHQLDRRQRARLRKGVRQSARAPGKQEPSARRT